jgi:hypothetical protein
LFDAVEASLHTTAHLANANESPESPDAPPQAVLDSLMANMRNDANAIADPETTLRLVEAVRTLATKHGPVAVNHCVRVVNELAKLLDEITGVA